MTSRGWSGPERKFPELGFLSEAAGWGQPSGELGREDEPAHKQEIGGKMMNEVQTPLVQSSC